MPTKKASPLTLTEEPFRCICSTNNTDNTNISSINSNTNTTVSSNNSAPQLATATLHFMGHYNGSYTSLLLSASSLLTEVLLLLLLLLLLGCRASPVIVSVSVNSEQSATVSSIQCADRPVGDSTAVGAAYT